MNIVDSLKSGCGHIPIVVGMRPLGCPLFDWLTGCKGMRPVPEAVCASAVEASLDVQAKLILCLTESGYTPRLVAKYRPEARLIAVTSDRITKAHVRLMR